MGEPLFDKVVLLSGTSGVGLSYFRRLAERLYGDRAFIADYEDYVKDISKTGIYTVASKLLWSPNSALEVFRDAYNAMVSDAVEARRKGARVAIIETHLSYLSVHMLIPNPVIHRIIGLGGEAAIIYYLDDFYHALLRMARYANENPKLHHVEGFIIDPLNYMAWRGLDHSLLNMLRARYSGVLEALIMSAKHSEDTHKRLLDYSVKPRLEGRREHLLAYVSHPITAIRKEYARLKREGTLKSIAEHEFVRNFETFKRRLVRSCPSLILFEPTTIDEISGEVGGGEDQYVVTREDRWPHERMRDYEDMYPVDIFDRETFGIIYGGSLSGQTAREAATDSILDWDEARPYYLRRLDRMIRDQIEVRDYEYVSQSSAVIAYEPIYRHRYIREKDREWSPSRGVSKELARAESQSKAIYVVAEPRAASEFVKETRGLFGEKIIPIELSDPSSPDELLVVMRESGFC